MSRDLVNINDHRSIRATTELFGPMYDVELQLKSREHNVERLRGCVPCDMYMADIFQPSENVQ
jgi:hypothetical protein